MSKLNVLKVHPDVSSALTLASNWGNKTPKNFRSFHEMMMSGKMPKSKIRLRSNVIPKALIELYRGLILINTNKK